MEHTFDIKVSQQDADTALRRFILRDAGWGTLVAAILCMVYVAYDSSDGNLGYLGIGIIALLLILILVYIAAFVTRKKQMAELLRKIGDAPISYRLDDSEIATKTPMGSSTLKWEMIKKLWIDPDLTLVFYARNVYTTIPTSQIPTEALEFLVTQIERVGGSILDNNRTQNKRMASNGRPAPSSNDSK